MVLPSFRGFGFDLRGNFEFPNPSFIALRGEDFLVWERSEKAHVLVVRGEFNPLGSGHTLRAFADARVPLILSVFKNGQGNFETVGRLTKTPGTRRGETLETSLGKFFFFVDLSLRKIFVYLLKK